MSALTGMSPALLAEVLVVSELATGSHPSDDQFNEAVESTIHRFHGVAGCLGELAELYGNDYATIDRRLPWAHDEAHRHTRTAAA